MQVHRVTTLRWLRPELLAALASLRELLLSAPSAGSGLQQSLDRFREIRGVLALAEAHPGELLAEEGTALLQWLVDNGGDAGDEARYLLLRVVTVLEGQLQASTADGAEAVVPLLNDLRTLRGERLFCESYLFAADLSLPHADAEAGSSGAKSPPPEAVPAYVRRLRSHYQRGLVQWLRRPETGEGLELMAVATGHLQDICADHPLAGLYRLATAFLEALRSRAAQVSISVRSLLTQVDQEMRRLAERGLDGMAQSAPEGLTRGLAYYLAQGTGAGERGDGTDTQQRKVGPGADVGSARRALARGGDIIANLVVDEPAAVNDLEELATILARTADTLALLGLANVRRSLRPSLMVLQDVLTKHTAPSEDELPVLAAGLLEGDQALEGFVEVEATVTAPGVAECAAAPDTGFLRSAAEELLAIRTAVAPLLADNGPVQDTDALVDRFRRIGEGLLQEGLGSGAAISGDCAADLEAAIGDGEWPLADEQRDACAEALVGFGYYLDALADGAAPAEGVLEYIKGRLAVPVPPPVGTGTVDPDEEPEPGSASDPDDIGEAVAAEVVPVSRAEEAMPRGEPPGAGGLPERVAYSIRHARSLLQTIEGPWAVVAESTAEHGATPLQSRAVYADPEFVDVFVEEATAIVEDIGVQLARWRGRPADKEISERVRGAFQALKTSARAAGAFEIAELAAALERLMMVGVTAEVTPATIALLLDAHGRLCESVQALEDDEAVALDFENLLGRVASAQQVLVLPSTESAAGVLPGADRFLAGAKSDTERPSVSAAGTAEELAELRRVFADEADEILQNCSGLQADWQVDPHGHEVLRQLHRHLHTLKGSARIAGLNAVSDLCHSEESLLTKALAGAVAPVPALKSLVQRCHDRLAGMVGIVRVGLLPSPAQDLAEEIRVVLAGRQAPMAEQRAASDLPGVPANGAGVSHDSPARVPVSAEKLDEMSHIAGEISVSRGRVERQVGATRGSLEDMEATLHRLRRQLGTLEAEMQARALSGTGGQDEPAPRDSARPAELQQTSRAVAASLSDLENLRDALEGLALDSQTALREQARSSEDLRRGLVSSRLVPLAPHVPRLRRLVASTAEELGKRVELVVEGDDVMLDAQVLSRLIAPLEHMLRNAIDHGVESPEDRLRRGKPVSAQLRLTVSCAGPDALVRLTDDGGGLDLAAIRREAAERGLVSQEAPVPDEQLLSCVFEQEFTTAPQVTQISGRGVGLDVVHSVVRQLGGGLSLNTRPGEGTEFTIRLPAVPSTSQVLMTRVGDGRYAVPLTWLQGVVRMDEAELGAARSAEPPHVEHRGRIYHLAHLASVLGEDRPVIRRHQGHYSVVLVRAGDHPTAWLVDAVTARQELVLEPVAPPASLVGWMAGAALAEDGELVFVLDMLELCARAAAQPLPTELETAEVPAGASSPVALVVDDSITLRKVTEHLLAKHGMQVALVRDRSEALAFLQDRLPDVVVIDVDNSGTEGHKLADDLRQDPRYSALPVIMLTPRGSQGHGNGAARRAVEVDLAKPYREGTLVDAVLGVLGHA